MKIGVDIGGSHIGIGIIQNNKILEKKEYDIKDFISNNSENDIKKYILNTIVDGISKLNISKNDIERIGIACCGTVKDGIIVIATNLNVYNFAIVYELKKVFKDVEITIKNDAKCAATVEKKYGALKDYKDAIFMTVGTGIGGAYLFNGELISPIKNAGFEYGHMIICVNGNKCTCGAKGCYETYASITAMKTMFMKEFVREFRSDAEITGKDLYEFIKKNILVPKYKEKIESILEEYSKYLALGISNLINILEPEVVVLGGSLVYYEKLLLERIKTNISIFNRAENAPEIKMALLGNDAGMIGAL